MSLSNVSADITMRKLERKFTYNGTTVLTLSIQYPEVRLQNDRVAERRINSRIQIQILSYYRYAGGALYQQAVEYYKSTKENGYPFHAYDAVLNYQVTYNAHCHLSVYRDKYEYMGGAHGNTLRSSDTWDLKTGRNLPLGYFFKPEQDYRHWLLEQILLQADQNIQQDPGIYFNDYRALIVKYFNPSSYYLTAPGLSIYYQQYEIAPYATGIVVFTIPYEVLQWYPSCRA